MNPTPAPMSAMPAQQLLLALPERKAKKKGKTGFIERTNLALNGVRIKLANGKWHRIDQRKLAAAYHTNVNILNALVELSCIDMMPRNNNKLSFREYRKRDELNTVTAAQLVAKIQEIHRVKKEKAKPAPVAETPTFAERLDRFCKELDRYIANNPGKYTDEQVDSFFAYWTHQDDNHVMRYETVRHFSMEKRLAIMCLQDLGRAMPDVPTTHPMQDVLDSVAESSVKNIKYINSEPSKEPVHFKVPDENTRYLVIKDLGADDYAVYTKPLNSIDEAYASVEKHAEMDYQNKTYLIVRIEEVVISRLTLVRHKY